jgi:hypothetical protein
MKRLCGWLSGLEAYLQLLKFLGVCKKMKHFKLNNHSKNINIRGMLSSSLITNSQMKGISLTLILTMVATYGESNLKWNGYTKKDK